MELKIKSIELTNFKGIQHKKIDFNGKSARLCAQNGGFKTTTSDSFYWVFCNCNTAMVNNPDVVPIGAEEVKPTVEIEMTIDDKPITIKKVQAFKRKENTSSVTNTYYINDVEKSQKDFIADLTERGINMEYFLMLSNPNAFMADTSKQGREKMRNILFKMCENISDEQIISGMKNVEELKVLLENYKLDECEQMQKSTLKKINDEFGKDNQIVRARISGIIQSKSQINVEETKENKTKYEAELEQVRKDFTNIRNKDSDIEAKIAELEGKCDEVERTETRKLEESNAALSEKLRKAEQKCKDISYEMSATKNSADMILSDSYNSKESLDHYRAIYKKVQEEVFDKDTLKCPTCGKPYSKDEADKMKKDFEESKAKRLADYKKMGESFSLQYEGLKGEYDDKMAEYDKKHKDWLKADDKVSKLTEQLRNAPRRPDMAQNKEYQSIRKEIEELRAGLGQTDAFKIQELSNRESYLIQMIKQADAELTLFEHNKELDEQIADLRKQQKDAEIRRADAEKVLDQIDRFKREKGNKLTENLNNKFELVSWKLYDYQRNGEIKEVCIPLIDNKPIDSCCNGSLITLCKISICADLQRNFQQFVPIWVEDYSLFSSNTESRLNADSQIIGLVVTEDDELKVEGE